MISAPDVAPIVGQLLGLRYELFVDDPVAADHLRVVYRDSLVDGSGEHSGESCRQFVLRTAGERFEVSVDGQLVSTPSRLNGAVNSLCWNLHRSVVPIHPNSVLVHAGAVVRDGRAVVVLGASGAGKTTTTLALARAGFDYLTDDIVEVATDGSIRGAPKPVGLRAPSLPVLGLDEHDFPPLAATLHPSAAHGDGAQRQVAASAVGCRLGTSAEPSLTLHLAPTMPVDPQGRIRRSHALASLVEHAWGLEVGGAHKFPVLAELARACDHRSWSPGSLEILSAVVGEFFGQ